MADFLDLTHYEADNILPTNRDFGIGDGGRLRQFIDYDFKGYFKTRRFSTNLA